MSTRSVDTRTRILRAAAKLLARGGHEAVSARAVSAAAGVQAPTIYRQFGDMQGLLDAVTRDAFTEYVRQKRTSARTDDPAADLRSGWQLHVAFGVANPDAYRLMYGGVAMHSPAADDAQAMLLALMTRVAESGQLRLGVVEAARLFAAAGRGVTLSLIDSPRETRDMTLADTMLDAMLRAILVSAAPEPPVRTDVLVMSRMTAVLSPAERELLREWLGRRAARAP